MEDNLRKTGIDVLGDLPWGTHFCQFYETQKDLLDVLIPFFRTGLEQNEFCMWVTSDPLTVDQAIQASRAAIPGFDQYLEKHSIEILPYTDWYLKEGRFDLATINNRWNEKLQNALANGYDGMRANGNETWLKREEWEDFMNYEKELNNALHEKPMIVLCAYSLSHIHGGALLDVAHAHESVVAIRKGKWEVLEVPEIKKTKAQLDRQNEELNQRVGERTRELAQAVEELKKEIAERKEAEEKLTKERELGKAIIESFPGIYKIIDKNNRILDWNHKFEELTGYTPQEIPQLDALNDLHFARDRKRIASLMQEAFTTGLRSAEVTMRMKDGRPAIFYYIARRFNYKDKPCLICCGIDITKRKKAEEQINRQIELTNEIINTIPIMAWSILPDGTVDFINQRWMDYAGLSLKEAIEAPMRIVHPDDLPDVAEKWITNSTAGNAYDDEMRLRRADGAYRWFLVRTAPMHDEQGKVAKWYGVAIDIEESKQAEEELRLAYKRLSYHVENSPLAVIEWDKDLFITRWSGQAEKIFGWKASEVLGKSMYHPDFPIVYREDWSKVDKTAHELLQGQVDRNLSLNRNYTKAGDVIYCEWYNSVLRDDQGKVVTILSLVHDVTDQRMAEENMNQSYQQIRSLTEHLQNIREEERTHIAREIHDELGQQLTVLKMDIAWLSKKLEEKDAAVKEKLQDLNRLLDATVQSVRKISAELRPSLLDDLGLVAAMDWHLKEFEKRSGIKTSFPEPEEEPELPDSAKTSLYRIFQESLTNVARHAQASKVTVSLEQQDGELTLMICDNGKGFDQETAGKKKTLGILGMRERAAMLGGTYVIRSEPGKGTTISVTIPLTHKS